MMQERVGFAAPPDRHHEGVGDELSRHLGLHRPADNASGEQVNDSGDIEPSLGGPDIGEVCDPLLVRPLGDELPVEKVGSDRRRSWATIFRQATATRASAEGVHPHQPLDSMQPQEKPSASTSRQKRRAP
jgi:hypothetical protein